MLYSVKALGQDSPIQRPIGTAYPQGSFSARPGVPGVPIGAQFGVQFSPLHRFGGQGLSGK